MRVTSLVAALVFATFTADAAHAFRTRTCEALGATAPMKVDGTSLTVRTSMVSFPSGVWRDSMINSVNQFNRNPSRFNYSRVDEFGGVGLNNGQSEVWGSTDQNILQGAPAIAYTYGECWWFFGVIAKINEGDVIFDYGSPWQWTPTRSKSTVSTYNGSLRLIQGTALHELGHAAGLMHENRYYNIMGADFTHLDTQISTVNAYMGEDAGHGLVSLYGVDNGGPQDIAVAHWRRIGASGEYSTHGRTRMFNTTGTELGKSTVSNEPRYNVTKGTQVQVEFTYENLGRSTINNLVVNYYLSTNDNITTADRFIGSTSMNLARDLPATVNRTVTIPGDLVSGSTFWLGAIMNMPAGTADGDTSNNTSYIRVRIN